MPKYCFECVCGMKVDLLRKNQPQIVKCPKCESSMSRFISPATARMVEVLDNGLMTRRIERPANAEQLYKERAADSEKDKHKL